MKRLRRLVNQIIVFLLIALFFLSGCTNAHRSEQPDVGSIQEGVYLNTYFGLSFPIPDDWHILDDKNQEILRQEAIERVVESDPTVKENVQYAQKTTYHLLSIFQYPMGTTPTNAYIMIVAEKIPQSIRSGRDYLIQSAQLLAKQSLYKRVSEVYDYSVGESPFSRVDYEIGNQTVTGYQSNIAAIRKGYAFSFVIAASTREDLSQLEKVLDQAKLEPANDDTIDSSKTTSSVQGTSAVSGIVGAFLLICGLLLHLLDQWFKKRKESRK